MAQRDIEAAKYISDYVNCFGGNDKAFAQELASDHPTLQQSATRLAFAFLREMAAKDPWDGRNKLAINAAKIAINAVDEARASGLPLI